MNANRRDFLKTLGSASTVFLLSPRGLSALEPSIPTRITEKLDYQYRTVPIEHLQELKTLFEKLDSGSKLSKETIFQKYLKNLHYKAPQELPNARSLIIAATPWKLRSVNFKLSGKNHVLLIPGGYFAAEDEALSKALEQQIVRDVLKNPGAKLVWANPPLKAVAVRTGLAEYGRNNIAYVERYGSFHMLWAYFTDQELPDQWVRPYRTMRYCKGCSICTRACPTKAFGQPNFLLDAGRCISLYNEVKPPIPGWIDAKAHNALIGCLKCQFDCPANRELVRSIEHVADISEQETALLLSGERNPKIEASISEKLKGLGQWYAKDIRFLSRNLKLALGGSPIEVLQ